MTVERVKVGRPLHRCVLPPVRDLWWAKVRCVECGAHWVSYGDAWFAEGLIGATWRMLRALWNRMGGKGE